jgi:hypothetical protein
VTVDLDDLQDELARGHIFECSLRDPHWHLDGLQEGENIYIDPRAAVLESLLHELIHRRKPRLGERTVDRTAKYLLCKMTEADKRRWWRAYRKIRQPRRPKVIE